VTPILITYILPTNTAFGVTAAHPHEAVFIPARVTEATGIVVDQEVDAILIPNAKDSERTPWMAVRIEVKRTAGLTAPSLEDRILEVLRDGGEWNTADMAKHLKADPDRVGETLNGIYRRDLCARYQLWRKHSAAEPSEEWFTCYPEEVEFLAEAAE